MDLQERITTLEQRLDELEAIEGIRDTIGRYARGVDYAQYDELESILADDIILEARPWFEEQNGKENAMNIFRNYRTTYQHPHRYITNERINIDGNNGTCAAYWIVVHSYNGQSCIGWGSYNWVFHLEDGIWKIAKMDIDLQTMSTLERGWGMENGRVMPFAPHP